MNVLLIHGMGRTPLSMLGLARRVRRAGHSSELVGYLSATQRFDDIVARVGARTAAMAASGVPYVVVGHSLGGLLARAALAAAPARMPLPLHLIMLGTPNQPSSLAGRLQRVPPFRWATGESGARLASADFFRSLPPPAVPYTIIAGTRGPRGRLSAFGDEHNDGKVAVSETRVHRHDAPIELPVRHTFMMNDARVQALILSVLERTRVSRAQVVSHD